MARCIVWYFKVFCRVKLTGGNKIPKNIIIRGFVKAFIDVNFDTKGLKKDDDKILFKRVRGLIKKG